jgi:hypothetical protein
LTGRRMSCASILSSPGRSCCLAVSPRRKSRTPSTVMGARATHLINDGLSLRLNHGRHRGWMPKDTIWMRQLPRKRPAGRSPETVPTRTRDRAKNQGQYRNNEWPRFGGVFFVERWPWPTLCEDHGGQPISVENVPRTSTCGRQYVRNRMPRHGPIRFSSATAPG